MIKSTQYRTICDTISEWENKEALYNEICELNEAYWDLGLYDKPLQFKLEIAMLENKYQVRIEFKHYNYDNEVFYIIDNKIMYHYRG
jgi:hypothetical protein